MELPQLQKLKFTVDEAVKKQRETEIKCQHKTAEMVALMEKHKVKHVIIGHRNRHRELLLLGEAF